MIINQLETIFKMKRLLKYHGRRLGLDIGDVLSITGVEQARVQHEDLGTFKYPETIEVRFDNWSTSHYSVRTKDFGWIRSGRNLNTTKPESIFKVYRAQLREMKAFREHLNSKQLLQAVR